MRAISILLIIFALIFGGAYYGAPWYIGQQLAAQKDSLIFKQELENAGLRVETVSYQSGLRQSQALYRLGDNNEGLEIKQVINHGPLLNFNGEWQNGLALVETRLSDSKGQPFPEHQLLSFLDWDGNMQNQLLIPAGTLADGDQTFSWQPLELSFNINADQSLDYAIRLDGLESHNAETHLVLGKVSGSGQHSGSTLNADSTLKIQSLAVAPLLNVLDFSQTIRLREEGQTVNIDSETMLAQLEVLRQSWKNGNITISLKNLDKEAIAALQANAERIGASPLLMLQILPRLLAAGPEVSIPNASIESPEGKIDLNVLLTVDGSQPFLSPAALFNAVTLDGNLRLPESYAVLLLTELSANVEAAQEKIRKLSDLGALIRRNNQIIVKFRLHRGGLALNDNAFDIEDIAAILR
jgi:uncharacterized protein YdgA (DUF945 family)